MKIKIIILFWVAFFCVEKSYAQDILEVTPEFKKTLPFDYSPEWHYLSTDLYIFNSQLFQKVLNELYVVNAKRKKNFDKVESILITSKITGTALGDFTYPIFNFKVDDTGDNIKSYATETYEVIRIIDNLPLSSIQNKIDANIAVDVITEQKQDKVFDFVSDQLNQIASFSTPLSAAKTLAGELGNMMKAKTKNEEYKFSSTIRLYEENDFSRRISSVGIFSFIPSKNQTSKIDADKLSSYLDSTKEPELSRNLLKKLINYSDYPFMVVVNYKSKYVSEPVVGDETTHETVEARRQKVKKSYENGLLSNEIYVQELKLIEFLELFVKLKEDVNAYHLNFRNRVTDNFSRMFTIMMLDYRNLKNLFQSRLDEFGRNSVFVNEFKQIYETILTNSEIYLDADNNLKNIKKIIQIVFENRANNGNRKYTVKEIEANLNVLHSIEFASSQFDTEGLAEINSLISKFEDLQYVSVFEQNVNKLHSLTPSAAANVLCEKIKGDINSTSCFLCREKATTAVNDYMLRLESLNHKNALKRHDSIISETNDLIFNLLKMENKADTHFLTAYQDGMTADIQYVFDEYQKMKSVREGLQNEIKKDISDQKSTAILLFDDEIQTTLAQLKKLKNDICKKMPEICIE